MKEFLESAKAFSIPHEAWYGDISVKPFSKYPYIMIGFYYGDGGTEGEFQIVWEDIGIKLKAYDDSWEALSKMPELLHLMSEIDRNQEKPSIREFSDRLKKLGYKDITERIRPEK
ncbi:MAG: hypothetical protein ACLSUP_02615 [Blautia massiliensis (ex Durand et al. 2017)]|uniref:hypothetical protein n=1 Tax=Blautia massiliensis (ex Durand et al. 2017) TaxID=1737424 RepID=UPI003992E7FB